MNNHLHTDNGTPLFDKNGEAILSTDRVIMPEPDGTDLYTFGGWSAKVEDVDSRVAGNILVTDDENDFHSIEISRVAIDLEAR